MTQIVAGYVCFLVIFGAIDFVWLSLMVPRLYLPTLGDMAAPSMRLAPAIVFYLVYTAGAIFFASARAGSVASAFVFGALLGVVAYSTYDLTNYATLRNWTLSLTLIDIFYGAAATGAASAISFTVMRAVADRL